jgi:copper/silver efflux system protein
LIQGLIEFAVRKRILVILLFTLIAGFAIFSLRTAHIDAIPDIGENQQIVFTEWPGRSPKDIEEQVTYPLSVQLQGVPGVKDIRGMSAFGFSMIYVIFREDIDFYWSRSRVLEKISTVGDFLPEGVSPRMGPDATGLGQVFWYTLENEAGTEKPKSLAELRTLQDFHVRYLLQGVEGVSEVASIGGFVKEYQIDVDPNRLMAFDVTLTNMITAITESNVDVGAEVIEEGEREFIVRGKGFFRSLQDIENVVLSEREGVPIRVKDVASVGHGPAFRRGALDKNGVETVGGIVIMRYGENPQRVIDAIKARIQVVERGLPAGVKLVPFYDRTELIQRTIGTVYRALGQEIILTILVILFFLLHFRSSLLVSLTLPFGVGISFIFMKLLDIDSNIMSLSGLVIAIGIMVDMGIIMIENIYAHLSEKADVGENDRIEVIIKAAREVGPPILTAIMTTIVTFLPVFGLIGSEGKLFGPLAWAKVLALLGAAIVSLTLIPALSVFLLKGKLRPLEKNQISKFLLRVYQPVLSMVLSHRKLFLLVPLTLLMVGAMAYLRLGKEFMPALNEGDILYMPVTTPDVSITKARELLSYTDKVLNGHPLVEYAVGKLGRAETAIDPAPVSMFETLVKLVPEEQWPAGMSIYDVMDELDRALQVPGLINSWNFPIQVRIGMISTGIRTEIGVKVFGSNLETLEQIAMQIGQELENIQGAYGIYAERITGKPYIEFDVDRVAASRYGINSGTINQVLQTAVGGMPIGQFYEGRERFPIRIRYKKELRDRLDELKRVLVPSPMGQHIPLEQLTKIQVVTGPSEIQSENGILRSVVMLNVRGRDIIGFVEEAKRHIEKTVTLPAGYTIEWAGQFENQQRANRRLLILIPLSLAINLIVIFIGIGNLRNSLIVFFAVPVAFAGGMIFLWLSGFNLSVAVWVGFIALFGIAVDDSVVMMSYLQTSLKENRPKDYSELKAAIIEAGSRRIRPLTMTSVTTIAALMPVLWSTTAGSEVMKPMAIPVIGGILFAEVTIFMVPVAFSYFEERKLKN